MAGFRFCPSLIVGRSHPGANLTGQGIWGTMISDFGPHLYNQKSLNHKIFHEIILLVLGSIKEGWKSIGPPEH